MSNIAINNTDIRRDAAGRYCLNDLHRAAGGEKRHQPSDFLRTQQTADLVAELDDPGTPERLQYRPCGAALSKAPTWRKSWSTPTRCGSARRST